jgi:predicted RNA-binding protein YlxR (DUF448 family)
LRMCAACGRRAPQKELIRLALSGKKVVWDPARRLPGRGAYICRRSECLAALLRKRRGERIFRQKLGPEAFKGLLSHQDHKGLFPQNEDARRI